MLLGLMVVAALAKPELEAEASADPQYYPKYEPKYPSYPKPSYKPSYPAYPEYKPNYATKKIIIIAILELHPSALIRQPLILP